MFKEENIKLKKIYVLAVIAVLSVLELLNGKGYPKQLNADDLDVMTRILTIMDIYDSLIADDRPYKKPKPVDVAFKILDEEAEAGKVDASLLEYAKDLYLRGSGN